MNPATLDTFDFQQNAISGRVAHVDRRGTVVPSSRDVYNTLEYPIGSRTYQLNQLDSHKAGVP
ncbi:protein of unknown function [Aminobacter niigataensis]|nr:protein of unknown function [Aminobacter niigataensis]